MKRYDGPIFNINPNPDILKQKLIELKKWGDSLYGFGLNKSFTEKVCDHLGIQKTHSVVQLALQIEEDYAVLHKGRLHEICFCFPSSWVPAKRIGMTLEDIHRPVGDGEKLVSASQKIAEVISNSGPYRRFVWTITNSGELSQYPEAKSDLVPKGIKDLWFRMETQTTSPLGDGETSLFLVKVDTIPLEDLWNQESNRNLILNSINSMSVEVLKYKNLEQIKNLLNQ